MTARAPLDGLRVLAVSQFGAGPWGTMHLADPGAEVIKIAAPTGPSTETEERHDEDAALAPPWMTILHNCECHTFEEVVRQLMKAIACSEDKGWEIAWQVHNTGKAVVKVGPEAECVRVGNILAAIGLVVTVVQS